MRKRKPSYRELLRERQRLLERLGQWPPVLRGSLRRHGNKCGNPGCACHHPRRPKLHGPYFYLSHRYRNKTQTIFLNETKLGYARQWMADYKRLIRLVYRLSEVNFRILRYHYDKLKDDK